MDVHPIHTIEVYRDMYDENHVINIDDIVANAMVIEPINSTFIDYFASALAIQNLMCWRSL